MRARLLLTLVGALLACGCGPDAPAREVVTRLLERGDAELSGSSTQLVTERAVEETVRPERLAEGLWSFALGAAPIEGSLRLTDQSGKALVERTRPRELLTQDGFLYLPPTLAISAPQLEHEPAWMQAPGYGQPDDDPFLRLGDPARRVAFRALATEAVMTLTARVRGNGVLFVELAGEEIGRRKVESDGAAWTSEHFEVRADTPSPVGCTLRAEGKLDLAGLEWRGSGEPAVLIRGHDVGELRASYSARPTTPDAVLVAQALATHRSLAEEYGVVGTPIADRVRRLDIGGDRRAGWWTPSATTVALEVDWQAGDQLRFAFGPTDDPAPAARPSTGEGSVSVRFRSSDSATTETLFSAPVESGARRWTEALVTVSESVAGVGTLSFEVQASEPLNVGIAEPRIRRVDPPTNERPRRPNLLVYTIDTLRADHLSCYGNPKPTSPNIDALADDGLLFERFLAVAPWTRPTTATMLTGYHPKWHAMGAGRPLDPELITLAEVLRDAEYSTWAAVANPQVGAEALNFQQGFERFASSRGIGRNFAPEDRAQASTSEQIHDSIAPWLRAHGDEPFFLYAHSIDPHAPYRTPPGAANPFGRDYEGPWKDRDLRRGRFIVGDVPIDEADRRYIADVYDNEIHHQDALIGRLIDLLRELDKLEDTIVVVTSDHGEEFREHGEWSHGFRMWDELLHVPLVIWVPERWRKQLGLSPRRITESVSQMSVLPTLLELLGIDDVQRRQAESVLALARGGDVTPIPFYAHDENAWEADAIQALELGPHKLIWKTREGVESSELYDLSQDPGETTDLGQRERDVLEQLEAERLRWSEFYSRPDGDDGSASQVQLDERTEAQLRALGYVGEDS